MKTMNNHRHHIISILLSLALAIAILAGCGTLELGVERETRPVREATSTIAGIASHTPSVTDTVTPRETPMGPTSEATVEQTQTARPTLTPTQASTATPEPGPLHASVAYVKEDNVWLWTSDQEPMPLTDNRGVTDVKISDDGQVVAFARGNELWMVRSDGTDERVLISGSDLAAMQPKPPFELPVVPNRFAWVPGTHIVVYNTRVRTDIGLALNDDLRLVDAESLKQNTMLPPSEGGEFYYAPDGRRIALVTSGKITVVDADGENRREVFTYTPPATYSEFLYYAKPTWSADSSSLHVAIPPADPHARPPQATSIWRISIDVPSSHLIGNIVAAPGSDIAFSPDLQYVTYVGQPSDQPQQDQDALLVTELDSDQTTSYFPQAFAVYSWAPEGQHFAFLSNPELPRAWIGQLGEEAVPAYDDPSNPVVDLSWIDAAHYLVIARTHRGWDILLGELDGSMVAIDVLAGSLPAYDFTLLSGAVVYEPVDKSSAAGLVYRTLEGIWQIDASGESVRLSSEPQSVLSPDGTTLLSVDATDQDLWLIDVGSGARRRLVQSPDRVEWFAQWWPARPEVVLFDSMARDTERGPGQLGYLTSVQTDGQGYRILDDEHDAGPGPFALSPDGETIAYGGGGKGWLYRWGSGPEPFDPVQYALTGAKGVQIGSPSWAPDGTQLAWIVGGGLGPDGGYRMAIGVFNLESGTAHLLHPYIPAGRGGWPLPAVWSRDGKWLAYAVGAERSEESGVWAIRADGQQGQEHYLGYGGTPVWSPDGRWLAFFGFSDRGEPGLQLARVGTWELYWFMLHPDGYLMDWIELS
jgi:Tol biopolymer transport system component